MSWIVIDRKTGNAVVELYSRTLADQVRRERFEVLTIGAYLARMNARIKQQNAEQGER